MLRHAVNCEPNDQLPADRSSASSQVAKSKTTMEITHNYCFLCKYLYVVGFEEISMALEAQLISLHSLVQHVLVLSPKTVKFWVL